ncbi:MAG: 16S rRNA (guanine(527)-N(7))-methyltransferase RsmG [Aquabacterium sp.]|uniref:16S rRNA (guanine(527)-N(7))-methyltransferase RsmG n=1 Tax=Aquabacterium sp. TaxID=1872578 RepID=UPI0025C5531F|nr:16S rRNA (guanine(527)-N(7))-methyltransferase RsmG [Aquabacterium sp.]MBI3380565.1 16S rRNA (guanine(527)-N(7))-methyltransferase RsmG [Aquabacterium sp.]
MASHHKRGPQRGAYSSGLHLLHGAGAAKPASKPVHKPAPRPAVEVWSQAQWEAALPPVLAQLTLPVAGVGAEQVQKLAAYMVMLAHWNSTFNLTALRDPQDMLTHHLTDCLAVLAPLARHLDTVRAGRAADAGPIKLLDVGSGGGLPGVVLAICCPDVQVSCVDTVGKKAAFIRQVAAELRLPNLRGEHARVEQLKGRYDLITSRAFASLVDFVSLTRAILAEGAEWMAMKGKHPDEELAQLPADIDVFHVEQLQVPGLDADRCLVWMRPQGGVPG